MSLVTIIIPTFNSGRTIRNALESVQLQSFQDWECIIVDGVSKDDTLNIVEEYVRNDSRFHYISEKDHGIYDAFNKGWRMAKSPWIHYLGSDDTLTHDGMKVISTELDTGYAVVTGDVYLHRLDGTIRAQLTKGYFGCHQGVLMQRRVIDKMGGFNEQYKIIADYDLLMRTKSASYKVKNVRVFLANFFVGGTSQRLGAQWKVMKEHYTIDKLNKVRCLPLCYNIICLTIMCLSGLYHQLLYGMRSLCMLLYGENNRKKEYGKD